MMIIICHSSEQVEMLEANMDILISDGLQNQDYLVVMETCLVLMKLAAKVDILRIMIIMIKTDILKVFNLAEMQINL